MRIMPNLGGWIHSFTVTDTQTHKAGFTIYKITSIIFPRSVPQALTCITVWKRFHEVKRLHRELSRRHKTLQLGGRLPEPTDSSYFKRFDAEVILKRKAYIVQLLDVIAQHPALYKCHAFTQFFSVSETPGTPPKTLSSVQFQRGKSNRDEPRKKAANEQSINEICDKLEMLYDNEQVTTEKPQQPCDDNECITSAEVVELPKDCAVAHEEEKGTSCCVVEKASTEDVTDGSGEGKDYSRFLTPMASIESDDSDYIYEAALEFSHAVQAEVNLEYQEAHTRYKRGVELLLNGCKDDSNDERKFIAKAKISKYLARAADIYDKFLAHPPGVGQLNRAPSKPNFQLSIDVSENADASSAALYLERPWNNLVKYKVLQVLGDSVLQVQSITEPQRPIYVLKGIEKPSSNTPTQTIFLPQQVPYMVDLLAFFQSEQKVFLLLREAEGGRLYDYIRQYKCSEMGQLKNYAELFPVEEAEKEEQVIVAKVQNKPENVSTAESGTPSTLRPTPSENSEINELMKCSQELLQSVSNTLKDVEMAEEATAPLPNQESQMTQQIKESITEMSTKLPEASLKLWASELVIAIHSLHNKGVILGDLHMDNLLLGSKGHLLLTYFYQNEGAECEDGHPPHQHKAFGSKAVRGHFVAPERPLTIKSDWWSYGVILYQLLVGLSFRDAHPGHIDIYGCVQYPEEDAFELSEPARDLLENLLQLLPEQRFDYAQICGHAFFKGIQWEEVRRNGLNTLTTTCGHNVSGKVME